jgi:hypothetical protein
MSLRPDPTAPTDMSPDERLDEVASILASGIQRLHGRGASGRPAKAGRFGLRTRRSPGVRRCSRQVAQSRVRIGVCAARSPAHPARPRSRFGPAHRALDENPEGSGRPLDQDSQTLSDSRLAHPPI